MTQIDDLIQAGKEALNDTADVCAKVEPGLEVVETVSQDISKVSKAIVDLEKYSNDLYKAFAGLKDLCLVLSVVPIVNSVASALNKVLSPLDAEFKTVTTLIAQSKTTLAGIGKTANTISKTSSVLRKGTSAAANNFHNYANSLDIVGSCLNLLVGISEILDDASSKQRIQHISDTMQHELNALTADVNALSTAYHNIDDAVERINQIISKQFKPVIQVITGTESVFSTLSDIFKPIADAFHAIVNAIKPLQWVLDAVACIFNKILKPVIDAILKACGLDKLIARVEEFILNKLGIAKLKSDIETALNSAEQALVGPFADDIEEISNKLASIDQRYTSMLSLTGVEQDVGLFLHDAYNAYVNQDLPDWPFDALQSKTVRMDGFQLYDMPYQPIRYIGLVDSNTLPYIVKMDRTVSATLRSGSRNTAADDDTSQWSAIDEAYDAIDSVVDGINGMHEKTTVIANDLMLCQKYATELDLYHDFLDDVQNCLALFSGLETFESLTAIIGKLDAKIESEKTAAQSLSSNMNDCMTHYQQFDERYGEVRAMLPSQYDIDVSYGKVSSVEQSWKTVNDTVDLGCETTTDHNTLQRIEAVRGDVDNRKNGNLELVGQYRAELETYRNSISSLSQHIDDITAEVGKLGGSEQAIIDSTAFMRISSIQTRLHALVGLVGPARQIANFLIEKHDKAEDEGKDFLDALHGFLDKVTPIIGKIIDSNIFDEFLNQALSLPALNDTIHAIDEHIVALDQELTGAQYTELSSQYEKLETVLDPQTQYTYADGTGTHTESNLYVDDAFVQLAQQVISESMAAENTGEAA